MLSGTYALLLLCSSPTATLEFMKAVRACILDQELLLEGVICCLVEGDSDFMDRVPTRVRQGRSFQLLLLLR